MMRSVRLAIGGILLSLSASAADVAGIWMGRIGGPNNQKNNEKQEIAFQFKPGKDALTGVMFGDEFDLPVEGLTVLGDHVSFTVTSINYYDGRRTKFVYSGTVTEKQMELTRERAGAEGSAPAKAQDGKQTFTLKRLT